MITLINTLKLKGAIAAAGYTQKTLAKAIGISENTLNRKVNRKKRMYVDEVDLLCDLLSIQTDEQKCAIFLSGQSQ